MNPRTRQSISGDELFRQVIEAEVDMCKPDMVAEERHACIERVSERLDAEIVEHLAGGDLQPELLSEHIHEEVIREVDGGGANAFA